MDFFSLKITLYAALLKYATTNVLIVVVLCLGLIGFAAISESKKAKAFAAFLVLSTSLSALYGARILHVCIEKHDLLRTPHLIFSDYRGMTFNGSLLFGFLTFYVLLKFGVPLIKQTEYWDMGAIVTSLSYGILRLGCFSNGCCWGKVTAAPWSVTYLRSDVMPWIGIPVHPVQLYDSLLGFSVFGLLYYLWFTKKYQGRLFEIFLIFYSLGRFFTEFYRGDAFRGESVILNFSTSQVVSLGILLVMFIYRLRDRVRAKATSLTLIVFSFFLSGCLPHEPKENEFKSVKKSNFLKFIKLKNLHQKNVKMSFFLLQTK